MNGEQDFRELVRETQREMGRNLINYQIVERVWKAQYKNSKFKTIVEDGEVKIVDVPTLNEKITMGPLAECHRQAIFSPPNDRSTDEEIKHITIETSYRMGENGELSEQRKGKITALVNDRNELAHSISEKFDHTTGVGCREVCSLLDEQNDRILEEIDYLNGMMVAFKDAIAELKAFVDSEEFNKEIEKG